jgi:hypothetical protein
MHLFQGAGVPREQHEKKASEYKVV